MSKRVLLMYISEVSGHHSASIAVENAIRKLAPSATVRNINAFNYTNPIWERIINRAYMSVVKNTPELWDYLYDNPRVLRRTRKIRQLIHKGNTEKLKVLFEDFKPDIVACTQAYPCGMVADYKRTLGLDLPLVGILTDYAPHSYWIYDNVDAYVVPSRDTGEKLVRDGVLEEKIKVLGVPIDPKFRPVSDKRALASALGLNPDLKNILIMGGGQGLGDIKKYLLALDHVEQPLQILAVTGTNTRLLNWIQKRHFRKPVKAFGYINFIEQLMGVADIIISKPGGVTTAEALAKTLPMIIVNPLPGQEAMNTRFLLKEGIALKAENERELADLVDWLLANPGKLTQITHRIREHAHPDAAERAAELILRLC
ncbi:MAG: glycosyltransferase [Candidatus Omnitrophota bacterium]